MKDFFEKRKASWVKKNAHANYFLADFSISTKDGRPNVIEKGSGLVFAMHGIDAPFSKWEELFETDESKTFLESNLALFVTAGPSLSSTDVPSEQAIGIIDYFPSYSDAASFIAKIKSQSWEGMTSSRDASTFKPPLYLEVAEVTDDFCFKAY